VLTDAELVDGVVAGYDDAFAQLYERHSLAAWRLGQTVTGNADDASDAVSEAFARVLVAVRAGHLDNGGSFRSYLLTATRNAALDNIRKTGRSRPTEQERLSEVESTSPTPPELLTTDEEAALVAKAFRNLPERWQSVLWLTEVEGVATKDAARRLGLSPNGAAQLAVRARSGLRERFLQAHLRTEADPQCRTTVDRLGAYVGGGLAPRDLAKVDQHLAGCAPCEARRKELEDLGSCLRRAGVPVPLVLAGALGAGGSTMLFTVGEKAARMAEWAQQAWAQKAAAAAAAGALALGAGGAYIAGSGNEQAAPPVPAISTSANPAEPSPTATPVETAAPSPAPASADESNSAPAVPLKASVPPDDGDVVTEPGCLGTDLEVGGDAARLGLGAGELSLARESRRDGSESHRSDRDRSEDEADSERTVATLGGVIGHDGFDRDAEPPSIDVDLDLQMGDLAARLALAADMARGGGLQLGVDVSPGNAGSSTTCDAGGVGLGLSPEGLGSP
jgi:RNA polymerase sigma factor (sigma-70 family)